MDAIGNTGAYDNTKSVQNYSRSTNKSGLKVSETPRTQSNAGNHKNKYPINVDDNLATKH